MIYILMESTSSDYDNDRSWPVFASTSLEAVEKKHDLLIAQYKKYHELYKRWIADVQLIDKENPSPPEPNWSKLPRRPLVWRDKNWQDPYVADHRELVWKHSKLVGEKTDQLKSQYIDFYKEAEPDIVNIMERIYSFACIPSYSIEEVESD